jgi:hypothetical protein
VIDDVVNEVGADETRTTSDEHPIHILSLIDGIVTRIESDHEPAQHIYCLMGLSVESPNPWQVSETVG